MTGFRETRRRRGTPSADALSLIVLLALVSVMIIVWSALAAGSALTARPIAANPAQALVDLAGGHYYWPWQSTLIATALTAMVLAGIAAAAHARRRSGSTWIDASARTMAPAHTLTTGPRDKIEEANHRLLAGGSNTGMVLHQLGPRLGISVSGGVGLYVPAEVGVTCVAGTRTGKTVTWAIPAMLDAWGPVVATSNKPDLYRHTRFGREQIASGCQIWVCDLQGVTGAASTSFWWNPLAAVTSLAQARRLAQGSLVSASRDPGARVDGYFDPEAQELFSLYLYAAALAGGDLLHAGEWLGNDQDQTPALLLRHYSEPAAARRVRETQALTARQRDGIYGMARRFLNVMTDTGYALVATPPVRRRITAHDNGNGTVTVHVTSEQAQRHQLPEFDPAEFVTSSDTLYAMSMDGPDSAAPLMTALVAQIIDAALATARTQSSGRLPVPLLAVLDEAANCCRLGELPAYYTYAGGHGIVLMTFLQVLEQGVQVWGEHGLNTMCAQSIEIYGGGIGDTTYLRRWSVLIGPHLVINRSKRVGRGGVDQSVDWRPEPILDEADLAAMPTSRALVRYPGSGPVLVRKIPWYATQHARLITESLRRYGTPATAAAITCGE